MTKKNKLDEIVVAPREMAMILGLGVERIGRLVKKGMPVAAPGMIWLRKGIDFYMQHVRVDAKNMHKRQGIESRLRQWLTETELFDFDECDRQWDAAMKRQATAKAKR